MSEQKITKKDKIDALIESMMKNSGKDKEELIWEAIQCLWCKEKDYRKRNRS